MCSVVIRNEKQRLLGAGRPEALLHDRGKKATANVCYHITFTFSIIWLTSLSCACLRHALSKVHGTLYRCSGQPPRSRNYQLWSGTKHLSADRPPVGAASRNNLTIT
ncbi:hypothetical protein J6590_024110 [Homalodisca vitripennis]|nr:hypothetical protein J6590_024110 [Homalodisca vitripennis]